MGAANAKTFHQQLKSNGGGKFEHLFYFDVDVEEIGVHRLMYMPAERGGLFERVQICSQKFASPCPPAWSSLSRRSWLNLPPIRFTKSDLSPVFVLTTGGVLL